MVNNYSAFGLGDDLAGETHVKGFPLRLSQFQPNMKANDRQWWLTPKKKRKISVDTGHKFGILIAVIEAVICCH